MNRRWREHRVCTADANNGRASAGSTQTPDWSTIAVVLCCRSQSMGRAQVASEGESLARRAEWSTRPRGSCSARRRTQHRRSASSSRPRRGSRRASAHGSAGGPQVRAATDCPQVASVEVVRRPTSSPTRRACTSREPHRSIASAAALLMHCRTSPRCGTWGACNFGKPSAWPLSFFLSPQAAGSVRLASFSISLSGYSHHRRSPTTPERSRIRPACHCGPRRRFRDSPNTKHAKQPPNSRRSLIL